MKTSLLYIILTLGFITPSFAAGGVQSVNTPAQTENKVSNDTKDKFLKFILEKAEKYSDKGEKALDKAVDLATQEAPILAKEFITWRIYKHFISGFAPLVIAIILGTITFFLFRKIESWEDPLPYPLPTVLLGIASFIFFIAFMDNFNEILNGIQAIVAPRIYILEQLAEFIKK